MFKLRGERSGTGVFGHLSFSPGMCFMGLRGVHWYATPVARQKPPFMQNPSVNRNGTPTTRRALSQVLSSEHPGRRVFQPHPLGHSGAVAGEGLGWGHPLCPTSLLSSVSLFGPFECDRGTQETVEGVRIQILEF